MIPLILAQAPVLLEQGRNAVLDAWIYVLPVAIRESEPWLLYWQGVSRMPFHPPDSRNSLEPAYALFKARHDRIGRYLSLAVVLTSYFHEWGDVHPVDPWITELEALLAAQPAFPSVEVEAQVASGMMALLLRCPQHPLLKQFKTRMVPLLRQCSTSQQRIAAAIPMILFCVWSGEFVDARQLIAELRSMLDLRRVAPLHVLTLKYVEYVFAWFQGDIQEAYNIIDEASVFASQTGMHLWDHQAHLQVSYAALSAGDYERAAQALADARNVKVPSRRTDVLGYQMARCCLAYKQREISQTLLSPVHDIIAETREVGVLYWQVNARLFHSMLLDELGQHAAAQKELAWVKAFAREMPSPLMEFTALLLEANSHSLAGNSRAGLDSLRQALVLGRQQGYTNYFGLCWLPEMMSQLFARALEANIEVDYVHHFIRVRHLKPPSPEIAHWPWPIKITTLGQFAVVINDQPLRFQGKAQKKPLELLKALIAHGGQNVSLALLAQELWPDLDGDAGDNACTMAVHRLRKLLQYPEALGIQESKLSLDASQVWVDVWAFERLCRAGEPPSADPVATVPRLLQLYPGPFLDGEEAAWTLTARERLRSKFLRTVTALGRHLEQDSAWEAVTALYQQALELHPLTEDFHRGLMRSYQHQGRIAEALEVYYRCRDLLSLSLGVKPSDRTEAVYRALRGL